MRTRFRSSLALLIVWFSLVTAHAQVPQMINYQGRVIVGTTNFNGTGQFKFALVNSNGSLRYWLNSADANLDGVPDAAVSLAVSNGLYSVLLGDTAIASMLSIPASVFNNSDVRLRVWFNDGTNGFQLLSPDQRIAAVGYAMVATTVPDGAITGAKIANTLTLGNPTVSGDLDFGAQTRQMINLYNTSYGIGIQPSTLYERSSGGNFAWFKGGTHSDTAFDPGSGGALTMRLDPNGELHVAGSVAGFSLQNRQSASYVSSPAAGERWDAFVSTGVYHLWSGADKLTVDLTGKVTASSLTLGGSTTAITAAGTIRGVEASAPTAGIAVRGLNGGGGASQPSSGVYGESTVTNGNGVVGVANTGSDSYGIYGRSANGYAGYFEGKVKITGTATVNVLTITGGADLAEPFRLSKKDLPKGSVVVIDEENPGHLTQSAAAYDKRVAGVISGANGVTPGIRLEQEGVLEGDENVALSGRVYVRAETSEGEIRPGDLLTTSRHPGRAMRVTDHARAQGAILGKAMSGLKDGEGYVLVLVTLQ